MPSPSNLDSHTTISDPESMIGKTVKPEDSDYRFNLAVDVHSELANLICL